MTNGQRTELDYFKRLRKECRRDDLSIKTLFMPGQPSTLLRKLSGPKSDVSGYDEVWIVVDEDGDDRVDLVRACARPTARRRSRQKWFAMVSRPCFEVWLIVHYQQVRRYQDQKDAQRHFDEIAPNRQTVKHLPQGFPIDQAHQACEHSHLMGEASIGADGLPPSPGTGMVQLIERLMP